MTIFEYFIAAYAGGLMVLAIFWPLICYRVLYCHWNIWRGF